MKISFFLSIAVCFVFILSSCEKTITNVNIPNRGRKIVLNSILQQDSFIAIQLHKSKYIMDNKYEYETINNAVVSIYKNNELLETINGLNDVSYYTAKNSRVQAGNHYKIEVSASDFPTVTTQTFVPHPVAIISLDTATAKTSFFDDMSSHYSEMECNIEFKDPADEENYYFLTVNREHKTMRYDPNQTEMIIDNIVSVSDPVYVFSNEIGIDEYSWAIDGLIFSDDLFNGKTKKFRFGFDSWNLYSADSSKINISLNSVSKEYYLYLKSYSKYIDAQDFGPFAEAVNVFGNIENGYGILGSLSASTIYLDGIIREQPKEERWW